MLTQCRNCEKQKELTGLSLETRLCGKCRTCEFCEYQINDGTIFVVVNKDYRGRKILCDFHLGKEWKDRICCSYDLEKLIEEHQSEKTSYLGLQQENKELKMKVEELEARVKELEEQLETSQLTAQVQINPNWK